jgi:hypothetical protein
MPRQHIDDLLRRVFHEAEALLRDLEAVDGGRNDLMTAGRYIKVITDHVEPLRRVVEDVEFHEKASALADDLAAYRMGPL